jgi:hypothetical protein
VLTIRPGVVIGYERNVWTNEKYDKAALPCCRSRVTSWVAVAAARAA